MQANLEWLRDVGVYEVGRGINTEAVCREC